MIVTRSTVVAPSTKALASQITVVGLGVAVAPSLLTVLGPKRPDLEAKRLE